MLYNLHHAAYSKMNNQYHIQTVAAEGPNGTWTSIDLLGVVPIIVTALLCKSDKTSTLGA